MPAEGGAPSADPADWPQNNMNVKITITLLLAVRLKGRVPELESTRITGKMLRYGRAAGN
jgi:hypothetical protein